MQVDTVELVKATPKSTLGQPLVDFAHAFVVHLVRAVEHHHILAQGITQVLQQPSRVLHDTSAVNDTCGLMVGHGGCLLKLQAPGVARGGG